MKIALAADHAGYPLKKALAVYLNNQKNEVIDFGVNQVVSVDYPDYAEQVARAVSSGQADLGILVCGTGQGMAISANKVPGIRAAVVSDLYSARMAKEHNNANVLALGARVVDASKAIRLVKAWMSAGFKGQRHQQRLDKISHLEKK